MLATRLAKEGKPELIELKPVERIGSERNQSNPTEASGACPLDPGQSCW